VEEGVFFMSRFNHVLRFSIENNQHGYATVLAWIDAFERGAIEELSPIEVQYFYQKVEKAFDVASLQPLHSEIHYQLRIVETADTDIVDASYLVMLLWQFKEKLSKVSVLLRELPESLQYSFNDYFVWLPDLHKRLFFSETLKLKAPTVSKRVLPAMVVDNEGLQALRSKVDISLSSFKAKHPLAQKFVTFSEEVLFSKRGGRFTPGSIEEGRKLFLETVANTLNCFSLIIFSCLYGRNRDSRTKNFVVLARQEMQACAKLAVEIANGASQGIENSIWYTPDKCGFLMLRSHYGANDSNIAYAKEKYDYAYNSGNSGKTTTPFAVEILIADFNKYGTIASTFRERLEAETLNLDDEGKQPLNQLLNSYDKFNVKHLICDDPESDTHFGQSWQTYRKMFPSMHTGLRNLGNSIRRCMGAVSLRSHNAFKSIDNMVQYFEKNFDGTKNIVSQTSMNSGKAYMPGTQLSLFLPISEELINSFESPSHFGAQFNQNRFCETYETYVKYLAVGILPIELKPLTLHMEQRQTSLYPEQEAKEVIVKELSCQLATQVKETSGPNYIVYTVDYIQVLELINATALSVGISASEILAKSLTLGELHNNISTNTGSVFLAICNADENFITVLKKLILSSLSAVFNAKLQIFIYDSTAKGIESRGFVLFGETFGEVLHNENVLRRARGYSLFDEEAYEEYCKKIENYSNKEAVHLMPFDSILKTNGDSTARLLIHKALQIIANKEYSEGGGKVNSHTRLGNKLHIAPFFEIAPLFTQPDIANRLAFALLRQLEDNELLKGKVMFYGYAEYSKNILHALNQILEGTEKHVDYRMAVYQHGTRLDSPHTKIIPIRKELPKAENLSEYVLIQIVPIASAFTTFDKILAKLNTEILSDCSHVIPVCSEWKAIENISFSWIRDVEAEGSQCPSSCEEEYISKVNKIDFTVNLTRSDMLPALRKNKALIVNFDFVLESEWQKATVCEFCYPKIGGFDEERHIVATDATSTIPIQQHRVRISQQKSEEQYDQR